MKFKFLKGVIATVAVALFIGYGVSRSVNNNSTEFDELTLANVEALADGEDFFLNGQRWTSEKQWYNDKDGNWTPDSRDCDYHSGSSNWTITIGFPKYGLGIEYQYQGSSYTSQGKYVECIRGSGNCWNGVDCVRA